MMITKCTFILSLRTTTQPTCKYSSLLALNLSHMMMTSASEEMAVSISRQGKEEKEKIWRQEI